MMLVSECNNRTEFTCGVDKSCIPRGWRCDGNKDCVDETDEKDCPKNCSGFICGEMCIPKEWVCDGTSDCVNGEDENLCSKYLNHSLRL